MEHHGEQLWVVDNAGCAVWTSHRDLDLPSAWWRAVRTELESSTTATVHLRVGRTSLTGWRMTSQEASAPSYAVAASTSAEDADEDATPLTPRQREVCEYAAAGATTLEIAAHLDIGVETVKSHLKSAYRVLGVANRLELFRALDRVAWSPATAPK